MIMSKCVMEKWWKRPTFTRRILNMVFDEGHCIEEWADFRNEYSHIGDLHHLVTNTILFYIASVTLVIARTLDLTSSDAFPTFPTPPTISDPVINYN